MDNLYEAVGDVFTFHSNYTSDVDIPSITVKLLPNGIKHLTTYMVDCSYSVILTLRQDESAEQLENYNQANKCFSSIQEKFGNGFILTEDITAVCEDFSMDFAGENYNVPQITFNFDYTDIFTDKSGDMIQEINLNLKEEQYGNIRRTNL